MTHKAFTALKSSIEHWKRFSEGKRLPNEFIGADNCALCISFIDDGCKECPVYKRKKTPACNGTPYQQILTFKDVNNFTSSNPALYLHPEFLKLAKIELSFLESLLPREQDVEDEKEVDLGF